MRTCVLHVGMAKTGSTSIQSTLAALSPSADFVLLQHGESNAARALAAAFMPEPQRFRPNRKRGHDAATLRRKGAKALKAFDEQLKTDAPLAVLSSEMLPGFDVETLAAMRAWLLERFDRIRVIAYVREPASYMESMVQQSLKNGNHHFDLERRYPAYRDHFSSLESVFGSAALEYRLFELGQLQGGCVVRDFASTIGLNLPEGAVVRVNEGLSREAVGLLHLYRRQFPKFGRGPAAMRRNRVLIGLLSGLPGRKLRLSPDLLRPVIERHGDDLAWMAGRLGVSIEPVYGPEPEGGWVSCLDDLSAPAPDVLVWFASQSGESTPRGPDGELDQAQLAQQIRRLVDRLVAERYGLFSSGEEVLVRPSDLLRRWPSQSPSGLVHQDAIAVVREALAQLGQALAACAAPTRVEGLGTFSPGSDPAGRACVVFVPDAEINPSEANDSDDDE